MVKDKTCINDKYSMVNEPALLQSDSIRNLIDIRNNVDLTAKSMAKNLVATFLPEIEGSDRVKDFGIRLKTALKKHKSSIVPFDSAFLSKGSKKRIKEGIVTFVVGERKGNFLPIRYVMTSTSNPIVTIVDMPDSVRKGLTYKEHMEIALNLFSWHMCHVAICVGKTNWIMYSFNGLSDFYPIDNGFGENILNNVIPKITSRVAPPKIDEFNRVKANTDFVENPFLKPYVMDLIDAGKSFSKTGLFDVTKNMKEFSYKDKIYEKIVSMHLDERRGMSYGFLARFLPIKLPQVHIDDSFIKKDKLFVEKKDMYLKLPMGNKGICLKVPEISVLMTRSGCDKTNLDPYKDVVKVTLKNGKMFIEIPPSAVLKEGYRPSFDTRVILAHGLSLAVYCSIAKCLNKDWKIIKLLEEQGLALGHWHGSYYPELPTGYFVYGNDLPPVLCSSYQSVIYAFNGKAKNILKCIANEKEYKGDIHYEPQHGVNVLWNNLCDLGIYILSDINKRNDLKRA